jgi:hypothetical protein
MPRSESSRSSHCGDRCERRNRHHNRGEDYYYYEYETGPNPLALLYLSRPIYGGLVYGGLGYGGLGYGGLGYGGLGYGLGYGRRFW